MSKAKKIVDEIIAAEAKGREALEKAEATARENINSAKLEAQNIIAKAEKDNEQSLREAISVANQNANIEAKEARSKIDAITKEYSERAAVHREKAVKAVIELLAQ